MSNRKRLMSKDDVIHDLVKTLSEDQIHEYIETTRQNNGYHIQTKTITKLVDAIENEKHEPTNQRLDNVREHLLSFIHEATSRPGYNLQTRVVEWLKKKDPDVQENEHIRGALTYPKYIDVDVHVRKQSRFLGIKDVWVEVKDQPVDLPIVTKLIMNATTVHQAKEEGIIEWAPDMLMLVSSRRFTGPALEYADSYKVYCVVYQKGLSNASRGRAYHFVGSMSEEDYDTGRNSEYPKHPSTTF